VRLRCETPNCAAEPASPRSAEERELACPPWRRVLPAAAPTFGLAVNASIVESRTPDNPGVDAKCSMHKRRELYLALADARLAGRRKWRVAADAGIDPAVLSRILNCHLEPTAAEARALAATLEREVDELFPDMGHTP
jgi:hypothetical protein